MISVSLTGYEKLSHCYMENISKTENAEALGEHLWEVFSKSLGESFTTAVNEDASRLINSTRMVHYANMRSHTTIEPYLTMDLPFSICSIISQLRMGLFSIKLGDRKITIKERCPSCISGSDTNVDHLTLECKILSPSRFKHLHEYG